MFRPKKVEEALNRFLLAICFDRFEVTSLAREIGLSFLLVQR